MNTSQIKNFAIQSRNVLKAGVLNRILSLGFDEKGRTVVDLPVKIQGGTVFMNQLREESFFDAWTALANRLEKHGIKEVCEEAAYTWFNRLVAIRIMQKNHFIEPVMQYVSEETRIPVIVDQARSGRLSLQLNSQDRDKLNELLRDSTKTNEQFNLLISAFCKSNPVIFKCFGGIEKHISLLLPDNILAQGGFIDLLNNTPYITDEDYTKSELIGWLYQFYISEKKDEVFDGFKKGKKAEAEDIPAATQIFTPNWIVKYMVENTIGRIYLDNNPNADEIKASMKYLVEPSEPTPKDAILKLEDLTEYKMIDNACGSGHILIEGFKLFYRMYMYEGYSSRVAIENILQKNIIGLDLDTRAKQLATFALLMTAAQTDKSFLDCRVMPRVLDFPEPFDYPAGTLEDFLPHYYLGGSKKVIDETISAFKLMKDADSLGSIMKFEISPETRTAMEKSTSGWEKREYLSPDLAAAVHSMNIILALTDKYTAVCANPPYMSSSNMNSTLSSYVEKNYKSGKADLFSVFMIQCSNLCCEGAKYGMINLPSWLFLSSFESLRETILRHEHIESLLHMGRGIFGIDWGSVSFVITKRLIPLPGIYFRLHKRNFQHIYYTHIGQLFEKVNTDHSFKFDFDSYRDESVVNVDNYVFKFFSQGELLYYTQNQENFFAIPGNPLAYWVGDSIRRIFTQNRPLSAVCRPTQGMATADNGRFVRFWFEPSPTRIGFGMPSSREAQASRKKWFPYNKGGLFRRWYGNQEFVVNWEDDGAEIKAYKGSVIRNPKTYFIPCLSWSKVSAGIIAFRYFPAGFLYDVAGTSMFFNNEQTRLYFAGLLNSRLMLDILRIISPTINFEVGQIATLPIIIAKENTVIPIIQQCIDIARTDWDAHETSWDFKRNELVRLYNGENAGEGLFVNANRLEDIVDLYKEHWTSHFNQLHANEEELNRQFIEIYGLQNELTPEVPFDEITILQNGEISIENNQIIWHDDVLIRQLISYAIGCWMGRYRLDKEGLYLAHRPSDEEIHPYEYNGYKFEIDDDAIIPLMAKDNPFEDDNALQKVINFMKYVFGGDSFLTENMNFIAHCLGKSLEDYLVKDFWKDHKKMYSNRPIYWLFSSKKGAFQVLTYMHRMNPYTVERIRTKYLLPYIEYLKGKIEVDEARGADLSTVERKNLIKMKTALDECNEYHDRLHEVALATIDFDLDDGVVANYAKFGDVLAKIK